MGVKGGGRQVQGVEKEVGCVAGGLLAKLRFGSQAVGGGDLGFAKRHLWRLFPSLQL